MSKRLNLREFQQNLIDRLQLSGLSESRISTLGVQIAGKNCLIDMVDIAEVLPLPTLTVVPYTKSWFRGVVNVRGNLYNVIDVASYLQSDTASGSIDNRILLVSPRHTVNAALLVDRVLGLRDARGWQVSEVVGQVEYLDESAASWRKFDVPGLLEQTDFLHVGV